ncbi:MULTISPECIES: hypothetical protein [Cupriavidus]
MQVLSWLTKRRMTTQMLAHIDHSVAQRLAEREPLWAERNAEIQRDYVPSTTPAEPKATPRAKPAPAAEPVPDYLR